MLNFLETEEYSMRPRIFVSSTFYDLKYARENLGDFIDSYGFEPIKFENGDIGYIHGQNLDTSCYEAMKDADIAIVIIGGRYGSPSSSTDVASGDEFSHYISVTRQEFRAARQANIPIFVFVEESVYTEYNMYKKNRSKFEDPTNTISFVAADNINIHRFIDEIFNITQLHVKEFREIKEIINYLRKQWAHMFHQYLVSIKRNEPLKKLEPSINNIYGELKKMDIMIQEMGSKLIGTSTAEYIETIDNQSLERTSNKIAAAFEFATSDNSETKIKEFLVFFIEKLYDAYEKDLLEFAFSENEEDIKIFDKHFEYDGVIIIQVKERLIFDDDDLNPDKTFKEKLINRLMKPDYLKMMNFL